MLILFSGLPWCEGSTDTSKSNREANSDSENPTSSREESNTIQEDAKEGEAEDNEGLPVYPYERVNTASEDPMPDIDLTKREVYCNDKSPYNLVLLLFFLRFL
jgi:gelsolin